MWNLFWNLITKNAIEITCNKAAAIKVSKWPIRGRFCQWEVDSTVLRPIRGRFCSVQRVVNMCLKGWNLFWNLITKIARDITWNKPAQIKIGMWPLWRRFCQWEGDTIVLSEWVSEYLPLNLGAGPLF